MNFEKPFSPPPRILTTFGNVPTCDIYSGHTSSHVRKSLTFSNQRSIRIQVPLQRWSALEIVTCARFIVIERREKRKKVDRHEHFGFAWTYK